MQHGYKVWLQLHVNTLGYRIDHIVNINIKIISRNARYATVSERYMQRHVRTASPRQIAWRHTLVRGCTVPAV